MRQDARRKKLVAGHWYGCGNCTPSYSPIYIPVDFFCPECLGCFPAIRNSRSTFWDSICLMYISQPWDLLKLASTKKTRDGLENCLALAKNERLVHLPKIIQLNQLKRENHLNLKTSTFILAPGFQPLIFEIFPRDESTLTRMMQSSAAQAPATRLCGKFLRGDRSENRLLEPTLAGRFGGKFFPVNSLWTKLPDFWCDLLKETGGGDWKNIFDIIWSTICDLEIWWYLMIVS